MEIQCNLITHKTSALATMLNHQDSIALTNFMLKLEERCEEEKKPDSEDRTVCPKIHVINMSLGAQYRLV